MRQLLECKDDITGHLQACRLISRLVGKIEEYELILTRTGIFDFPPNQLKKCGFVQSTGTTWVVIGVL